MSTFAQLMSRAKKRDDFWVTRAQHDIAIQLAKAVKAKGLTQAQFATAAGVSPAYISKVLAGNENLSIKSLVKLTRAVGASLNVNIASPAAGYKVERIPEDSRGLLWKAAERNAFRRHGCPQFVFSRTDVAMNESLYGGSPETKVTDRIASAA